MMVHMVAESSFVRTRRQRRHGPLVAFTVYSACAIGAVAWFSLYQFGQVGIRDVPTGLRMEPRNPTERYQGTVVIPRKGGGCRGLKFDNVTGALEEDAVAACNEPSAGANSTEGRMTTIRDAFSKKGH